MDLCGAFHPFSSGWMQFVRHLRCTSHCSDGSARSSCLSCQAIWNRMLFCRQAAALSARALLAWLCCPFVLGRSHALSPTSVSPGSWFCSWSLSVHRWDHLHGEKELQEPECWLPGCANKSRCIYFVPHSMGRHHLVQMCEDSV